MSFISFKILLATVAFLFVWVSPAQERTTKETKVVLVINEKSDAVEHIELFASFQKMKKKELAAKYAHHNFFLGVLKGTYDVNEKWIVPGNDTTIIIYTEKQFSPFKEFFQGDDLIPGDELSLGKTKARVIAHKKGELTLKTL